MPIAMVVGVRVSTMYVSRKLLIVMVSTWVSMVSMIKVATMYL